MTPASAVPELLCVADRLRLEAPVRSVRPDGG